jgi:lipopolysaccharide assembly protein A
MRFIKFILLVIFFLVFMVFFVQNNAQLSTVLELKFNLFNLQYQSQPIPFYIIVLVFFVAGALFSTLVLIIDRIRVGAHLSQAKSRITALEKDLDSLRGGRSPIAAPASGPAAAGS